MERGGHADKLGDEGEPVDDHEVDQRKPAPERAEPVEDGLGSAAFRHRAEAHRHLLHVVGGRDQQQQEPDQVVAIFGAGCGIGGDAAGVVVGHHHHDPGAGDDQVEPDRLPGLAELVVKLGEKIHLRYFESGRIEVMGLSSVRRAKP